MNYRDDFFEWIDKQPVYQDMTTLLKEQSLELASCWLNNNQAYRHYARLQGRDFAIRCAVDFCWFIKNSKIADLEEKLSEKEEKIKAMETLLVKVNEAGRQEFEKYIAMLGKNRQLEQQILEKEKETADSEQCSIDYQNDNTMLEQEINHLKSILDLEISYRNKLLKTRHQDKISFCIEKLNDVRSFVSDSTEIKEPDYTKVCNYIENQTEQLKKELKDD